MSTVLDIPLTLTNTSSKLSLLFIGTTSIISPVRKETIRNELGVRVRNYKIHLLCSDGGPAGSSFIARDVWTKGRGVGHLHMIKEYKGKIDGFTKSLLHTDKDDELVPFLLSGMDLLIIVPQQEPGCYETLERPWNLYEEEANRKGTIVLVI